jgi:hypothetical protein
MINFARPYVYRLLAISYDFQLQVAKKQGRARVTSHVKSPLPSACLPHQFIMGRFRKNVFFSSLPSSFFVRNQI